jgi:superfamily II DNA or RNA helicase
MKAVLSHRIYMECTREYREFLSEELTYIIPNYNPTDPPQVIKNMARIRENLVTIPVGRLDLIPEDYEIVDNRVRLPQDFPEFNGVLRASQHKVFTEVDDNAMINAWVSWGKTFTALAIAGKLKQKTLIVCHTIPLRNQWEREIKKVFDIDAGILGSGRFDIDAPIAVGNIQTLYRNIPKIKKAFGTVILDEFHHVSAKTFSSVIDTNYARYKIGLSGTMKRKDGKHVMFRDYFGSNLFQPPKENYMVPEVDVIKTDIRFPDGGNTPWASRVNILTNDENYRHLIAQLSAAYAAIGHKVLVVADRVQFLKHCSNLVGDKSVCITGDISHEERELRIEEVLQGEYDILYGTQSIFSEGISVPPLSCLIMATPIGNNEGLLEQLIGRVIREHPGKLTPKIVDIHFIGNTARRQASARMGTYIKAGYKIRQLSY